MLILVNLVGNQSADSATRDAKSPKVVATPCAKAGKKPVAKANKKLEKAGKVLQTTLTGALKAQPKTVQIDPRPLVEQWGQDLLAVDATYGSALTKLAGQERTLADQISAAAALPTVAPALNRDSVLHDSVLRDSAFQGSVLTQLPPGPLAGPAMVQMAQQFGLNAPAGNETKAIGGAKITTGNDGNGNITQAVVYAANEPADHGPIAVTQDFSISGPINPSSDGTITLNVRVKSAMSAPTPSGNWIDEREVTGIVVIRVGDNQNITDATTNLRVQTREGVGVDTPYTDATIKGTLTNASRPGPNGSTELRWDTDTQSTTIARTSSTANPTKSANSIANAIDFANELIATHLNSIGFGPNKARLKKPTKSAAIPPTPKNGSVPLANGVRTMLTRFHVTFHDLRFQTFGPSGRVETQIKPLETYGWVAGIATPGNNVIGGPIYGDYIPWESVTPDGKRIEGKAGFNGVQIEGAWDGAWPIPPDTKLTVTLRTSTSDDLTATITLAELQSAAQDDLHFEISKDKYTYSIYLRIQGECTVAFAEPNCGYSRTPSDDQEPATPLSK